jgi:hypothetical protein
MRSVHVCSTMYIMCFDTPPTAPAFNFMICLVRRHLRAHIDVAVKRFQLYIYIILQYILYILYYILYIIYVIYYMIYIIYYIRYILYIIYVIYYIMSALDL